MDLDTARGLRETSRTDGKPRRQPDSDGDGDDSTGHPDGQRAQSGATHEESAAGAERSQGRPVGERIIHHAHDGGPEGQERPDAQHECEEHQRQPVRAHRRGEARLLRGLIGRSDLDPRQCGAHRGHVGSGGGGIGQFHLRHGVGGGLGELLAIRRAEERSAVSGCRLVHQDGVECPADPDDFEIDGCEDLGEILLRRLTTRGLELRCFLHELVDVEGERRERIADLGTGDRGRPLVEQDLARRVVSRDSTVEQQPPVDGHTEHAVTDHCAQRVVEVGTTVGQQRHEPDAGTDTGRLHLWLLTNRVGHFGRRAADVHHQVGDREPVGEPGERRGGPAGSDGRRHADPERHPDQQDEDDRRHPAPPQVHPEEVPGRRHHSALSRSADGVRAAARAGSAATARITASPPGTSNAPHAGTRTSAANPCEVATARQA